jgi:hypothetical protein
MNGRMTLEQYAQREAAKREEVLETSNRGKSAYYLATQAIENSGSGSEAAAKLLLSMEYGTPFNMQNIYKLDTTNRAHAEIAIAGCVAHELWPSGWMNAEGFDGNDIMQKLRDKWQ